MVSDTHMTLAADVARVKWDLWASPLELPLAADYLGIHIGMSAQGRLFYHGQSPKHVVKHKNQHFTLHSLRRPHMHARDLPPGRGGMRQDTWTWEVPATLPVSISSGPLPPQPPQEEVSEWAIANTPLQTTIPEPVATKSPYVTRVEEVSPGVRTDVVAVDIVVKEGMKISHLRVRVASILSVPPDRLRVIDMDNTDLALHLQIPTSLRMHDKWSAESITYDIIMEIYMNTMSPESSFVLRINQLWTHEQVMEKIAQIMHIGPANITLTDMHGTY